MRLILIRIVLSHPLSQPHAHIKELSSLLTKLASSPCWSNRIVSLPNQSNLLSLLSDYFHISLFFSLYFFPVLKWVSRLWIASSFFFLTYFKFMSISNFETVLLVSENFVIYKMCLLWFCVGRRLKETSRVQWMWQCCEELCSQCHSVVSLLSQCLHSSVTLSSKCQMSRRGCVPNVSSIEVCPLSLSSLTESISTVTILFN